MGCGGSRVNEPDVDSPLNWLMEATSAEKLDAIFIRASPIIQNLETLRDAVVDKLNEVIIETGASSHIKPTLKTCIKSFLLKLAVDNGGDVAASGFIVENLDETEKGYKHVFHLNAKHNSADALNAFAKLNSYIINLQKLKYEEINNQVNSLKEEIKDLNLLKSELKNGLGELGKNNEENLMMIPGKVKIFNDNIDKINKAIETNRLLIPEITKSLEYLNNFNLTKLVEKYSKINTQVKEAIKKSYQDLMKLLGRFSNQRRGMEEVQKVGWLFSQTKSIEKKKLSI